MNDEITWRKQLPELIRYLEEMESLGDEPVLPCDAGTLARWTRNAVFHAVADFLERQVPPRRMIPATDALKALFDELSRRADSGPAEVDARWIAKRGRNETMTIELRGAQLRVTVKNEFGDSDDLRSFDSSEEARAMAEAMVAQLDENGFELQR